MTLIIKTPHKQVIAKVNSYVDEGIKELVELLNTFENVETFESCQGKDEDAAFIMLSYGIDNEHSFDRAVPFVKQLVKAISEVIKTSKVLEKSKVNSYASFLSPLYRIRISIEWLGDMKYPFIYILIPSDDVERITKLFYKVKEVFDNDS